MYDIEALSRYVLIENRLKELEEHYERRRKELVTKNQYAHMRYDHAQGKMHKSSPDLERYVIKREALETDYAQDKRVIQKDRQILKEAVQLLYPEERKAYHAWKQSGFVMNREIAPILEACLQHVISEKNWSRETKCAI